MSEEVPDELAKINPSLGPLKNQLIKNLEIWL